MYFKLRQLGILLKCPMRTLFANVGDVIVPAKSLTVVLSLSISPTVFSSIENIFGNSIYIFLHLFLDSFNISYVVLAQNIT